MTSESHSVPNTDRPLRDNVPSTGDEAVETQKVENSLRSLIIKVVSGSPQIFKYFEKYDIHEKYIDIYEEAFIKCEELTEIIEVIKEMFTTLMNHIQAHAK